MKAPKTFKYPRIYRQEGTQEVQKVFSPEAYSNLYSYGPRTRIVYPDGSSEWYCDFTYYDNLKEWRWCCWNYGNVARTGREALKKMSLYDKIEGFPRAVFIGEIKD
jgi:hypothetical protein